MRGSIDGQRRARASREKEHIGGEEWSRSESINKESKLPRAAALSYRKNMAAPKLTAKGTGKTAEKILSVAQQNNIPIQRDPSLVALLSQLEINEKIPQELY
ncbi:EscU/YscU/HrcU family type III secretion system export apparatus switch protein [Fictibacillus sp. NRS-1165]|uniref:EscU/YscU/HrcU family type III secretion system export apparatus switch protein n=1 Tax=Fictibacillus sp. NRS-1165 TaxID=3144463 RepID=UPI003D2439C8